jgi:F-type H+-transporting ATPase subunit c
MTSIIAEAVTSGVTGNMTLGLCGTGAGIGIGLVGAKLVEAVGRNPGAFGRVLALALLGMALAESIAIYGIVFMLLGH